MISNYLSNCRFYGNKFYPEQIEKDLGIKFYEKKNPEESEDKIGYAILVLESDDIDSKIDLINPKSKYLKYIKSIKLKKKDYSIDGITMSLIIETEYQSNISFSPNFIGLISSLGIHLVLSVRQVK